MPEYPRDFREEPSTFDTLRTSNTLSSSVSKSPSGRLLSNFLQVMNKTGKEAQSAYDSALAALREHPEEVIIEIARAENGCNPNNYPERWALIYTASELQHPATLPFLRNIVLTPIPPETSNDTHSFSTVAEETILRTTAVEGVEILAVNGDQAALESLFEFLGQPSLSIRRAAVQGILATPGGEEMRGRIAERLPEDQRFLLDIKRVSVQDVPQVRDPRAHLAEGVDEGKTTPAPRLPDEPESDVPTVYKR